MTTFDGAAESALNRWARLPAPVVAAVLVALAACGDTTGPDLRLDPAVRVLHAAPETPTLEVALEASRARLEYAEVSDYMTVPAGDRQLRLFIAGDDTPLIDLTTTLAEAAHYTILAAGQASSIQPIVLVDDPTPADSGSARVRVVHAAPTAGAVDLYITQPGADIAGETADLSSLAFGESSDYMVVDARTYQVRVTSAGGTDLVIDLPLLVLSSTRVVTIVMMDTEGSGPPHGLIALHDDPR